MQITNFNTDRLTLRLINPEIAKNILANFSTDELLQFYKLKDQNLLEKEIIRLKKGQIAINKSYCYFHLLDKTTNEYIGWAGFHTLYLDHDRAELGYEFFNNQSKGKGLMTEALEFIIDYGFTELNLHRIEAFVGPNNLPSLKLMHKFGFTKEGQLREHYFKHEKFEDSIVFSILKHEYNI